LVLEAGPLEEEHPSAVAFEDLAPVPVCNRRAAAEAILACIPRAGAHRWLPAAGTLVYNLQEEGPHRAAGACSPPEEVAEVIPALRAGMQAAAPAEVDIQASAVVPCFGPQSHAMLQFRSQARDLTDSPPSDRSRAVYICIVIILFPSTARNGDTLNLVKKKSNKMLNR